MPRRHKSKITEDPIIDTSISYINKLKQLKKAKTIEESNKIMTTFGDVPKSSKVYFRHFIPKVLENIDKLHIKEALILINDIYSNLYPNMSTLDSILSKEVRKPIIKRFGLKSEEYKLSKSLVKISYKEKGKLIEQGKQKVFDKNANRINFSSDEVIDIIKDNINDVDPIKRAIALLLSSGSRPIELFEKSTYTPDESDETQRWIIQSNIAKSKTLENVKKPLIYFNNEEFAFEVKRMREDLHLKYPSFINAKGELISSITGTSNRYTKEIFKYKEGVTQYILRKLYGIISYELYSKAYDVYGKNPSLNVWLNHVLGHNQNSFMTSHNYSHVNIINESILPEEIVIRQEVIEKKIEDINNRLDEDRVPKAINLPKKLTVKNNNNLLAKFEILKKIYDKYMRDHNNVKPTQTMMLKLGKDILSREKIKVFYKSL